MSNQSISFNQKSTKRFPSRPASDEQRSGAANSAPLRVDRDADREMLLRLYYTMRLTREFEDSIFRLYQQGKIVGGAYSGRGNEATSVGSAAVLGKNDYLFPLHRDMGAHIMKGQSVKNLLLQYLGRREGMTRGRDGTGHYVDPSLKIYGNISHLGAMVPVAAGVALASKLRKENAVVLTYIGEGGASVGEVHEGLIFASVQRLPLILIIENNQFAYSTPVTKEVNAEKLSDRAIGYGIPGVTIDGTDVLEVYNACLEAADRARRGEGPTIIESITMRMQGHAAHDTAWYVPKEMLKEWKKRDPVEQFERKLLQNGIIDEMKKRTVTEEVQRLVSNAVAQAESSPMPAGEEAITGVYEE